MIEDDTSLHALYRDALAKEDVAIVGVTSGKDGIAAVKKDHPDMIILDIMLPGGINGFDVCEQLKKDPTTASIPILVLTNLDSERKTAMDIGAVDYLVKANTSMDGVVSKVKAILKI